METLHCNISGRVQGVGFRYSALSTARSLDLSGWVRNCADGSLETQAWGEAAKIAGYLDWLRTGPPAARVDRVTVLERKAVEKGPGTGFTITF